MKLKLLFLAFIYTTISFAQLPTSNLLRSYDFTNGSLTDAANGDNLTQTGTNLTLENDRFATSNNSVALNNDYLSTTNFSFTDFSISFWIKTDINDTNERTILDKSDRTNSNFGGTNTGFYLYLKDGRIGFKTRRKTVFSDANSIVYIDGDRFFNEFISNNDWHHITITIKKEATQYNTASGGRNTFPYTYKFYVDSVLEQSSVEEVKVKGIFSGGDYSNGGSLTIGNIRSGALTTANIYNKSIDDVNIYSRVITDAEVSQIGVLNNYTFCETPNTADLVISNISKSSADVTITGSDMYNIAYGLESDSFANYTIINNVSAGVTNLTPLISSSKYNVQYRKICVNNTTFNTTSSWSFPVKFVTDGPIYVNKIATGLNDGSSWANAFQNISDALNAVKVNGEIWIAKGTYTPDATDRNATFSIEKNNISLFGGFAGTETSIFDRNISNNPTILSGDLAADDNGTIDYSEATISDNAHHIVTIQNSGTLLDGFTISGGNAVDASDNSGAAINFIKSIGSQPTNLSGFTIKNSTIKDNVADQGSFFYFRSTAYSSGNRNFNIENCIIENNLGRYGTIHMRETNAENTNLNIYNTLFKNNTAKDRGSVKGQGGSVAFLLSNSVPSRLAINVNLTNCTIVNNQDLGTNTAVNNFTRSPLMLLKVATLDTKVSNTIFWNNTTIGGSNSRVISSGDQASYGTLAIANSIANLDFANQSSAEKTNTSNNDPLFTSATDFTLQTSSPAIDFGDNSKLPAILNIDLAGNNRIFNSTVDLGVYEFGATTFKPTLTINATDGSVTTNPNPTNGSYNFGENVTLTAVPNAGFEFVDFSGDITSTNISESIILDSNKTITANFRPIQYALNITSDNGTVTTNPNPVNGTYDVGTVVTLTATPNTDFSFDSWTGDATGNINPLTITMDADKNITANYVTKRVYVNINATGTNDGTTWANAYTSLATAMANNTTAADFWVAKGTYSPGNSRADHFFLRTNQSIFGGFDGTEIVLADRNLQVNTTILSGDVNANDDGVLAFNNATYNDNNYRVLVINATTGALNGITISGGNGDSNSNVSYRQGSAVTISQTSKNLTFKNIVFKDNRVIGFGVVNYGHTSNQNGNYNYIFENCMFQNNLARLATAFYGANPRSSGVVKTQFINTIFYKNKTADFSSSSKGVNTIIWLRNDLAVGTNETEFINCTFTENSLTGTDNQDSGVISASRISGNNSIKIYNSIFYNNIETINNGEQFALNNFGTQAIANSLDVQNSLSPLDFVKVAAGDKQNILTSNPQFVSSANNNVRLTASSPAIDVGNNSLLPNIYTTDFAGNARILNNTIDLGAYEFDASATIQRTLTITTNNGVVTTNSNPTNGTYDDGTVVALTATPNTGYQFDGWSGDATGTTNPLNITMDADKNVTAMFSLIQYTLTTTASNGTISADIQPTNGTYDYGTVITLTATPNAGFDFVNWTGDDTSSTNPLAITMNSNISLNAVFSATANINDEKFDNLVSVFPNPVNDILYLKIERSEIKTIEIYNLLGKKVKSIKSKVINVKNLPNGIYIVKIISINDEISTKKVVKN